MPTLQSPNNEGIKLGEERGKQEVIQILFVPNVVNWLKHFVLKTSLIWLMGVMSINLMIWGM